MQYVRVIKESIKRSFSVLKSEEGSLFVFQSGTMSICYKNGIVGSARLPASFLEGSFPSERFVRITGIKGDYLYLRMTHKNQFEIKKGTFRTRLNVYPIMGDELQVNLWDEAIQWLPCHMDLVQGICLVADVAAKDSEAYQPAFAGIYIDDSYVVASDDNHCRFCRYKLSFPAPFKIGISPKGIKKILRRLKDRKSVRVAEVDSGEKRHLLRGMAFDFGDTRIWVPRVKVAEQITGEFERGGGFVCFGQNYIISSVHNFLSVPCDFIIRVPHNIEERIPFPATDKNREDRLMEMTFMKRKIHFLYRNDQAVMEDHVTINNDILRSPVTIQVDPLHFMQAIRGKSLMGLLPYNRNDGQLLLYFKNRNLEHAIRAQIL